MNAILIIYDWFNYLIIIIISFCFPMQKRENIEVRISWVVMVPVISPRWWRFVAWRGSKIQAQPSGLCLFLEVVEDFFSF